MRKAQSTDLPPQLYSSTTESNIWISLAIYDNHIWTRKRLTLTNTLLLTGNVDDRLLTLKRLDFEVWSTRAMMLFCIAYFCITCDTAARRKPTLFAASLFDYGVKHVGERLWAITQYGFTHCTDNLNKWLCYWPIVIVWAALIKVCMYLCVIGEESGGGL